MIAEILHTGKDHPITGKELATIFNTDIRHITAQIEAERREGQPICANMTGRPGYYMADGAEELQQYCSRLHRRAGELHKTRRILLGVLSQYAEQQAQEETATNGTQGDK